MCLHVGLLSRGKLRTGVGNVSRKQKGSRKRRGARVGKVGAAKDILMLLLVVLLMRLLQRDRGTRTHACYIPYVTVM